MKSFQVTLIHKTMRVVRNVIAPTAIMATRIGIGMMPDVAGPLSIICKPIRSKTA